MEAAIFIYLAGVLGELDLALGTAIGALAIATCAMLVFAGISAIDPPSQSSIPEGMDRHAYQKERTAKLLKPAKRLAAATVLVMLINTAMPTERTAYLMAGGYLGQQAITSDVTKDLQEIVALKVKQYKQELQSSTVTK